MGKYLTEDCLSLMSHATHLHASRFRLYARTPGGFGVNFGGNRFGPSLGPFSVGKQQNPCLAVCLGHPKGWKPPKVGFSVGSAIELAIRTIEPEIWPIFISKP